MKLLKFIRTDLTSYTLLILSLALPLIVNMVYLLPFSIPVGILIVLYRFNNVKKSIQEGYKTKAKVLSTKYVKNAFKYELEYKDNYQKTSKAAKTVVGRNMLFGINDEIEIVVTKEGKVYIPIVFE